LLSVKKYFYKRITIKNFDNDSLEHTFNSYLDYLIALYHSSDLKQKPLPLINISFNLRGKTRLGSVRFDIFKRYATINVHLEAYSKLGDTYLRDVFSHEFAHVITYTVYGKTKPHGSRFVYVCKKLFPQNYESIASARYRGEFVLDSGKKLKVYDYVCGCQIHKLTSIRHNRILRKMAVYKCKKCKGILKPCN